jgi:hypothetical protein
MCCPLLYVYVVVLWFWLPLWYSLLSVISWSNISFGVERYFQLYRDQLFYLVLNATFNNIVVEETTDLTQSHCVIQFQLFYKYKYITTMNFLKEINLKENQPGYWPHFNYFFPLYSTRTLQVNIFLNYLQSWWRKLPT